MKKLQRITAILDYYASMGVNKEKINTIYRKILNDEKKN
jgi:hypothetical protein